MIGRAATAAGFALLVHTTLAVSKCEYSARAGEAEADRRPRARRRRSGGVFGGGGAADRSRARADATTRKKKNPRKQGPASSISHAHKQNKNETDRDALKVTQRPYDGVPLPLQLELLLGALLALAGGCLMAGTLRPIASDKGAPSLDQGSARPDCVFFGHRGRALPRPDIPSVY